MLQASHHEEAGSRRATPPRIDLGLFLPLHAHGRFTIRPHPTGRDAPRARGLSHHASAIAGEGDETHL